MDLVWLISLLVFGSVFLASAGLYSMLEARNNIKRMKQRAEWLLGEVNVDADPWVGEITGMMQRVLSRLGKVNKSSDESEMSALRARLVSAGYRHAQSPIMFMGAKLLAGAAALATIFLVPEKTLGFPSAFSMILVYAGSAFTGYVLPEVWLRLVIAKRKEKILDGFPDTLDLMVVCLEAGLGLDAAIIHVSREIRPAHPELAEELHLMSMELNTGLSRAEALKNLSCRVDLEDVASLVALLVQTEKFGTSVTQALRVHSDAMRTNRQVRAEEQAAKLPVKLLFPLVFFIFPSLFVVIVGPAAIQIMRNLLPAWGGR